MSMRIAKKTSISGPTMATPALDAGFGELADERIKAAPICYYLVMPVARVLGLQAEPVEAPGRAAAE